MKRQLLVAVLLASCCGFVGGQELPDGATARMGALEETGPLQGIYLVKFSPSGKLLATRGRDQVVRLWDVDSGNLKFEFAGHEDRVLSLVFSPDSKLLVTGSMGVDEAVCVWDTATGQKVREVTPSGGLTQFADDGEQLMVVHGDKFGYYSAATGEQVKVTDSRLTRLAIPLALTPDGKSLLCYENNGTLKKPYILSQFPVTSGDPKKLLELEMPPVAACFSSNGQRLALTCRRQNEIHLLDLQDPHKHTIVSAHEQPIQSLAYSSDGRFLASASWDKTVHIYDALTNERITALSGHKDHVCAVAFSRDGLKLASGASGVHDNTALIWEVRLNIFGEKDGVGIGKEEFNTHWDRLTGEAPGAFRSIGTLWARAKETMPFIEEKLAAITATKEKDRILELIEQLDADDFKTREEAQRKLITLRVLAEALLRKTLEETKSFEVKTRIKQILETPASEKTMTDEERRQMHRLIYVLELVGNDQAVELLESLSTGFPNTEIILAAGAAAERVKSAD